MTKPINKGWTDKPGARKCVRLGGQIANHCVTGESRIAVAILAYDIHPIM